MGILLPNDRKAGFRIPLTVALSHMKRKTKGNSEHKVESPWDKTPVEQREHACPFSNAAAHFSDMWISRVHNPFGKAVKQDISGQAAGEHHTAPGEKAILWLFPWNPQHNIAVFGKHQI